MDVGEVGERTLACAICLHGGDVECVRFLFQIK